MVMALGFARVEPPAPPRRPALPPPPPRRELIPVELVYVGTEPVPPWRRTEIRRAWPGGKRFSGLAVSYGRVSSLTEYEDGECFERLAFASDVAKVNDGERVIPLTLGHKGERVGWITAMRETREGLEVEGEVDDPAVLLRAPRGLSVGFFPDAEFTRPDGVRVVAAATLDHVALVPGGAYADARVFDPPVVPASAA